jgi:two-component system response regulator YesN
MVAQRLRRFKKNTIDTARELLEQPDVKIADVAHETGFSNPAHFIRFFRALSGATPREYRASHLQEAV